MITDARAMAVALRTVNMVKHSQNPLGGLGGGATALSFLKIPSTVAGLGIGEKHTFLPTTTLTLPPI